LIGEEIAGEWNRLALDDLAATLGCNYQPYDSEDVDQAGALDGFEALIAAESRIDSQCAYTYRPTAAQAALILGNEAKGIRRKTLKRARATVEVPVPSLNMNCLNVAAAASILLYYLTLEKTLGFRARSLASIQKDRPDVLLLGGHDPMELGSVVRSACAFGWDRVGLDDGHNTWYECDRVMKAQGRGAARRGRNPIRVSPWNDKQLDQYERVVVASISPGIPIHDVRLLGQKTLVVLPDESQAESWTASESIEIVHASLTPLSSDRYHYRQAASIALAEIARQLGKVESGGIYLKKRADRYRKEIEAEVAEGTLDLEDLCVFL
jgi:hypothetical protein